MKKKVFILVGMTGVGKSTLGNCIINQNGNLDQMNAPFVTSDSVAGCTRNFACEETDEYTVIDTVGFGDPQFEPDFILQNLRCALNKVENKIDCVLFVIKVGRVTREFVNFFNVIQREIFEHKCNRNFILVGTGGSDPNWFENNRNINPIMDELSESCNNLTFAFSLKFDHCSDDEEDRMKNVLKRQESINKLIGFIERQPFQKTDLSHIQTEEFGLKWSHISASLVAITGALAAGTLFLFKILK